MTSTKRPRPLKIADSTGAAIPPAGAATPPAGADDAPIQYLDPADMHKLFHMGAKVDRISAQIGLLEKDNINDELNLKLQQETLQRLQTEFALRRARRTAELQQHASNQGRALDEYIAFRTELGEKHGMDFTYATFDDETGRILITPPPTDSETTSP